VLETTHPLATPQVLLHSALLLFMGDTWNMEMLDVQDHLAQEGTTKLRWDVKHTLIT